MMTLLLPSRCQRLLKFHDYDVVCATSVPEALSLITSQTFDVLISDLNIGHPADGFVVVSAMRRTNPNCINFILTGYPALETALQALREQVDDYLIKPSDIPTIVRTLEYKLKNRTAPPAHEVKRLSRILRENISRIAQRMLAEIKQNPELTALPLSDDERLDRLARLVAELADHLDAIEPTESSEVLLRSARRLGKVRRAQQFPLSLMVENERILLQVIHNVIHENLRSGDFSHLLLDLARLSDALLVQLAEAQRTYLGIRQHAS
jgi:ActR/RegA family two-component response regulator